MFLAGIADEPVRLRAAGDEDESRREADRAEICSFGRQRVRDVDAAQWRASLLGTRMDRADIAVPVTASRAPRRLEHEGPGARGRGTAKHDENEESAAHLPLSRPSCHIPALQGETPCGL
jgi:hypothetical protein